MTHITQKPKPKKLQQETVLDISLTEGILFPKLCTFTQFPDHLCQYIITKAQKPIERHLFAAKHHVQSV